MVWGNKRVVSGKCLAAIIEGVNDNEMVYAITVLTINLSPLFFDLLRSRAFYSAVAVRDGCQCVLCLMCTFPTRRECGDLLKDYLTLTKKDTGSEERYCKASFRTASATLLVSSFIFFEDA